MEERKKNTRFVLLINAIIAILFLSAQYYTDAIGIKKILFIAAIVLFIAVFVPGLSYYWPFMNELAGSVRKDLKAKAEWIRSHPKEVLKAAGMYLCACAAAVLITFVISRIRSRYFITPLFHMLFALLTIPVTVFLCRKTIRERAEILFAALLITAGTCFINSSPVQLGVTWDDEAHYERTVSIVTLPSGVLYASDQEMLMKQPFTAIEHYGYSEADRAASDALVNTAEREKQTIPYIYRGMGKFAVFSYLPFAFGITMGRGLHLPFTLVFRLGKIINLLTYAAVVYYAMKRLRFGKILLATIAMVPTMTYMASTYSYDPCVVACTMLGFAVFFSYLQNPDSKMTNRDIALICLSFLFGCLPKAVYCVIMLPLLFMPLNRFVSKKQHTMYIVSGCITVLLLLSTFVLPMLLAGGVGGGDARGGTEVNGAMQLALMKEDPKRFLNVLWTFLTTVYLAPSYSTMYSENYAYLGVNLTNYITPLLILVTALTDKIGKKGKTLLISTTSVVGSLLGIVIVAVTFYISFTPVGHNTILGCQWRYLLPMAFPFLYAVSFDRFRNPLRREIYNAIPMIWMAADFIIYTGIEMIKLF